MSESEMFKTEKGFNTDYFNVGQLIKITIQNFQGMFLEIDYGFITKVRFNEIAFSYIGTDGKLKEKVITPTDILYSENELKINIEIVSAGKLTPGGRLC